MRVVIALVMGIVIGAVINGCWVTDPDHCMNLEGDRSCAEGSRCSQCELDNNGCVAEIPSAECYWPGKAESLGSSTSMSNGTEPQLDSGPGVDGDSSGGSASGTGPGGCTSHNECTKGTALFCHPQMRMCVTCTDMADVGEGADEACAQREGGVLPVCLRGVCAQCSFDDNRQGACEMDLQVCGQDNSCEQCSFHDECVAAYGSGCHIDVGRCLDPGNVWYVDGVGGDGTEASPFATIGEAMALIGAGEEGTIILQTKQLGVPHYDEQVTIDAGQAVAIAAHEGQRPQLGPAGLPVSSVVHVNGVAEGVPSFAYLEGLRIEDGESVGLLANSTAVAYLDSCEVVVDDNYGIWANANASLHIRNSTIWANHTSGGSAALRAQGPSTDILYTTIFNASEFPDATSLMCDDMDVAVRNSILISQGNDNVALGCPGIAASNSKGTGVPRGKGNQQIPNGGPPLMNPSIISSFVDPVGPFGVDLRLTTMVGSSAFQDVAVWQAGDPPVDIDGNLRPALEGADYAGAHVPQ